MLGKGLCELSEDLGLKVEYLGNSLNDHVYVAQVVHFGGRGESFSNGSSIGLADLLLGDIFGKELVGEGQALVEGLLRGINQCDRDASRPSSYEGNAQTLHSLLSAVSFINMKAIGPGGCISSIPSDRPARR